MGSYLMPAVVMDPWLLARSASRGSIIHSKGGNEPTTRCMLHEPWVHTPFRQRLWTHDSLRVQPAVGPSSTPVVVMDPQTVACFTSHGSIFHFRSGNGPMARRTFSQPWVHIPFQWRQWTHGSSRVQPAVGPSSTPKVAMNPRIVACFTGHGSIFHPAGGYGPMARRAFYQPWAHGNA